MPVVTPTVQWALPQHFARISDPQAQFSSGDHESRRGLRVEIIHHDQRVGPFTDLVIVFGSTGSNRVSSRQQAQIPGE